MLRVPALALCALFSLYAADPAGTDPLHPSLTCPAGAPLGSVDLRVRMKDSAETLPLASINHLSEGDTVVYSPVIRGAEKRPGEVALVLVPANRKPDSDLLIVTDSARANESHEWQIPQTMNLAALVYGPQGLSKKKVRKFLSQDDQLVAQLADYAEKTSQTEALLQALNDVGASSASMNAALNGFASQYGLAVQIDKTAPAATQAQMLFSTMNPQLATYNPIASSAAERVGQTASVAAAAATLFFGTPIGLAAGGTAMVLDLRSIAFPGTQFRSSFAQEAPVGMRLCGQRGPLPPHTRPAYIWALRIPNVPAPAIQIGAAHTLPSGQKVSLPVDVPSVEWKYLQRARNWALQDSNGKHIPLKVFKIGTERVLEIDLQNVATPPGAYRLTGYWDWKPFTANGTIDIKPLSDFKSAAIAADSQNALVANNGKVPIRLQGDDFEFADKVELKKLGDKFATAEPVRFLLPKGLRLGPQTSMDVQIDTTALVPGEYRLLLTQQDGVNHPVPLRILAAAPQLANLPILMNQGMTEQHYVLKGQRLDLFSTLEASGASVEMAAPNPAGTERAITLKLAKPLAPGDRLSLTAHLNDRTETFNLPDALEITGPAPVIASSRLSTPEDAAVSLRPNEFPAGATLTALLDVRNFDQSSEMKLACAEDHQTQSSVMRIGAQTSTFSLQPLSADQLFLSYDTSAFPAGCTIQAVVANGRAGSSPPFALARLIRLPQIDSFTLGDDGNFHLTGRNLEMIQRLGWTTDAGVDIANLPVALAGPGQKQSLTVGLPEPPKAASPLYLWLRGDEVARNTRIVSPNPTNTRAAAAPIVPSSPYVK